MVDLLAEGAQDFIVKPFAEPDLRVRLRNLVAQARSRMSELRGPPRAPTAPRTSSWRCSATSCAIRCRRS